MKVMMALTAAKAGHHEMAMQNGEAKTARPAVDKDVKGDLDGWW